MEGSVDACQHAVRAHTLLALTPNLLAQALMVSTHALSYVSRHILTCSSENSLKHCNLTLSARHFEWKSRMTMISKLQLNSILMDVLRPGHVSEHPSPNTEDSKDVEHHLASARQETRSTDIGTLCTHVHGSRSLRTLSHWLR